MTSQCKFEHAPNLAMLDCEEENQFQEYWNTTTCPLMTELTLTYGIDYFIIHLKTIDDRVVFHLLKSRNCVSMLLLICLWHYVVAHRLCAVQSLVLLSMYFILM